ncbi:MAG: ribose 5-phosphate isomerase B [Flavobacteriales bacterium MED-G22]|nr:MAG: ribose 5-phosphate isomerase B [Flavobacteriales bacterium MED-G22]|tara:strand:+ start:424 stop:849 length:426 start_codon:yes stop_codon:yes gene_type:complete
MKISIGNDHAGYIRKNVLVEYLNKEDHNIKNYGTDTVTSVDYPDFVHPVAKDIIEGNAEFGILLCGSGNGVAITANKYKEVRAALCWNKELANLARAHNNANILCIPSRFITEENLLDIVESFLKTPFEGGRHQRRVDKIC